MRPLSLALFILLVAAVSFSTGCGGGSMNSPEKSAATPNVTGNWQLLGTSQTPGTDLFVIGGLTQSGTHLSGSVFALTPCVTNLGQVAFSGTVSGNAVTFSVT